MPALRSSVLGGAIAGLAGGLLFATLHALIIVPIWNRMVVGLIFGVAAGTAGGWAYAELQRWELTDARSKILAGATFGFVLWLAVVPVTLVNIYLRHTGFAHAHEGLTDAIAVVLALAGGALLGWLRSRRRQSVIAASVAALFLTMAMGGPVPVGRSVRAMEILFAVLIAALFGGVVLTFLEPALRGGAERVRPIANRLHPTHLERMTAFQRTVESYRQGAHTMPRERYTSPEIFAEERERIFARSWNCVGRASAFAKPGDYQLRTIADESLILVRDRSGELHAFFNVCRHRGTRLCRETTGQLSETIQCPYHAWTYALDGRLIGAPHMNEVEGFDKKNYPLHEAAVAEWEGFVFVNIDTDPRPFDEWFAPMLGRLARFELSSLNVGHRAGYEVGANWKLVFQNYSECLHCPMIHPELSTVLPYTSGANDLTSGPFLGGYMEIKAPNESATLSGRACGRPVSTNIGGDDARRAYYYTLMPNLMLSLHPDYVNYYLLTPVAVDRTIVETEWMFSPNNEGDPKFNPRDAIDFWDVTNRQDWDICERSQLGIFSRRYVPGPYSPRESIPAAWDHEYLRIMGAGQSEHR